MVLNNITLKNIGLTKDGAYDFSSGLSVIGTRSIDELSYVIRLVSNHKLPPLSEITVGAETRVEASVSLDEKVYRIFLEPEKNRKGLKLKAYDRIGADVTEEYLYLTSHSSEHDLSDVFEGEEKETLLRFLKYKYEDVYYSPKELSWGTDGFSDIKAFRAYLRSFIDNFKPELIRDGKQYEITIEKSGRYLAKCKIDNEIPALLSESDRTLFRYLCFLRTAEFWHGFESLRNLHGTGKPLIVKNFFERLDESIHVQPLLERTAKLNRQVVILTTPNTKKERGL